ncbi:hypothetical protein [Bacteroides sp. 224]|uniref:hypothetical protein n=1 Tax=Bacteroides sp. 224 TaxID=2302936 RepID=UPI0013D5D918|nr:hypothetical protein [Bacteroides sp. 224]NDV65150.1 hypothetical protein [Bacteroides sp. 224]
MRGLFDKFFAKKFDKDQIEERFEKWLEQINSEEKIDSSIVGFNFGLFESTDGYMMYLIGSKSFDKEDEDWATEIDFEPQNKYFEFGEKFSKGKKWEEIQKYSESLVANYIRSDKFKESILSKSTAITTGFDDGNLTILYLVD